MSYARTATNYLAAEVGSRSPEWLVPLLYEHLLISLRRADVHIEARDFEQKAEMMTRANDIVFELLASLDTEQGGAIAGHLGSLYAYFVREIHEVERSLDRERLARLIAMIADLHAAWVQAAEQVAPRGRAGARPVAVSA